MDVPVAAFLDRLAAEAQTRRATDIHLEPTAEALRVRFRVDGQMQEGPSASRSLHAPLLARLRLLGGLATHDPQLPGDGRLTLGEGPRRQEVRLSLIPTLEGEAAVLRLLSANVCSRKLADLGMDEAMARKLQAALEQTDGLIAVTGPTGSGKTTTLYALLDQLDAVERKVLTIEDPVERPMPDLVQGTVRNDIGLSFARLLRAALRQAPDVLMVGEVRDTETASIAVQAGLTGHLILTTLHTTDAPAAIGRMRQLGVEDYLLASVLRGVLAQRLVRKFCHNCAVEADSSDATVRSQVHVARLEEGGLQGRLRLPVGCPACRQTGYRGRIGVFSWLPVEESLRELVAEGLCVEGLRKAACEMGYRELLEDAQRHLKAGTTSLAEVLSQVPI